MILPEPNIQCPPEEALTNYLADHNLKKTRERYVVLAAAREVGKIFTAAELHGYIEKKQFHLSLATVYSSLRLLGKCGLVVEHLVQADSVRFEYAYGKTAFKYMVCSHCGRIKPITDKAIDRAMAAAKVPRMHPSYYKAYIFGVCASCVRKENARLRKIKQQNTDDTRKS